MSLPLTFESQPSQGQLQYQQQQSLQFQMRSSSGSNSPNSLVQENARHNKRSRGLDEEDDYGFDMGVEHESGEGQDGKEAKAKP
jgi:hypothetical protein